MGGEWDEFAQILDLLHGDERGVGVCFDTCHAHAAGHRVNSARWVGRTLREFENVVGLSRLRLIHLNDSHGAAGSHIDHHQHIGRGTIGDAGIRAFLRRRELRDRCAVLETPIDRPGDDRRNLKRARALARRPVGAAFLPRCLWGTQDGTSREGNRGAAKRGIEVEPDPLRYRRPVAPAPTPVYYPHPQAVSCLCAKVRCSA